MISSDKKHLIEALLVARFAESRKQSEDGTDTFNTISDNIYKTCHKRLHTPYFGSHMKQQKNLVEGLCGMLGNSSELCE